MWSQMPVWRGRESLLLTYSMCNMSFFIRFCDLISKTVNGNVILGINFNEVRYVFMDNVIMPITRES